MALPAWSYRLEGKPAKNPVNWSTTATATWCWEEQSRLEARGFPRGVTLSGGRRAR